MISRDSKSIRYADDEYGTNMSESSEGKKYIGFPKKENPVNEKDYCWSEIIDKKGDENSGVFLIRKRKSKRQYIFNGLMYTIFSLGLITSGKILYNLIIQKLFNYQLSLAPKILIITIFILLILGTIYLLEDGDEND